MRLFVSQYLCTSLDLRSHPIIDTVLAHLLDAQWNGGISEPDGL